LHIKNKLNVSIFEISSKQESIANEISNKLNDYLYQILFVDKYQTTLVLSRYRLPDQTYNNNVEFKFLWSFGDPKNEAKKLEFQIKKLIKKINHSI